MPVTTVLVGYTGSKNEKREKRAIDLRRVIITDLCLIKIKTRESNGVFKKKCCRAEPTFVHIFVRYLATNFL